MSDPVLSSNDSFLAPFMDARLAPGAFTHRAILTQRCGAPEQFHCNVTEAFVRLIAGRSRAPSWEAFAEVDTDLLLDGRRVLARYYSDALLGSTAARERVVPPDLEPLP